MTEEEAKQKAQDILDEACLGEEYYRNGVVAGLKESISAALLEGTRRYREALAPFAAIPEAGAGTAAHYWCVIGTPDKVHLTRDELAKAKEVMGWRP